VATTTFPMTIEDARQQCPATSQLARVDKEALSREARWCFTQGIELLNRGEAREAAACFARALAHSPDFADAHVGLGIAYAIDSRIYPALDHLERAAALEPKNFYTHFKLGQFYFKLRIPQKGYAETARALACAATLDERRLVAQILREERQRESSGVRRPWWNRPFSRSALYLGAGLVAAGCAMLVLYMR